MSYETEYHSGYEPHYREGLEELADHYKEILTLLGEDTSREGLMKTPMRVAKAMQVLTRGYEMDAHKVLTDALFKEDYSQMVIVKDIDFFSLCEQIKDCIQDTLKPLGVMVVVEAKHMCMQMRGIEKQNAITTTSDFSGAFNQAKTRQEFMNLIHNNQT